MISTLALFAASAQAWPSWWPGHDHDDEPCPPQGLEVQQDFDLDAYISDTWWIQQQMPTEYLPVDQNFCVKAKYSKGTRSRWAKFIGWTIQVENFSKKSDGTDQNSGDFLCARQVEGAKLEVAPCFLPAWIAAGPYWVLEHNEPEGYALVSGGAPEIESNGACKTGDGVNDAGLWIFTRRQLRNETLVDSLMQKLVDYGYDTSVMNPVDNFNCPDN